MLTHGFQQRRLNFGRRPIDFICQNQVVKNGSMLETKGTVLGTVNVGPRDICWEKIRCELDPVKISL